MHIIFVTKGHRSSVHRQCRCYVTWEGSKVSSTASSNAGRTKTIELPDSFQTRIHVRAMWERARPCINWQWRGLPGSPRDHIEGYIMLWLSSVHIHKVTNLRRCRPCLAQVSLTHRNAERCTNASHATMHTGPEQTCSSFCGCSTLARLHFPAHEQVLQMLLSQTF